MKELYCPNFISCQLVHEENFLQNDAIKQEYLNIFCKSEQSKWNDCKRYITKNEIHFCPRFVMPDTELSVEEIIEQFENLEQN